MRIKYHFETDNVYYLPEKKIWVPIHYLCFDCFNKYVKALGVRENPYACDIHVSCISMHII